MMMFVRSVVHKELVRVSQCIFRKKKIPGKGLISHSALSDVSGPDSFISVAALATVGMSVTF